MTRIGGHRLSKGVTKPTVNVECTPFECGTELLSNPVERHECTFSPTSTALRQIERVDSNTDAEDANLSSLSSIAPPYLADCGGVTSQRPVSLLGWSLALGGGIAIWSGLIALLA